MASKLQLKDVDLSISQLLLARYGKDVLLILSFYSYNIALQYFLTT